MNIFSIDTIYTISEYIVSFFYMWGITIVGSYGLIHWGFNQNISFKKVIKWISMIIGAFGLLLIGLYFVPHAWQEILTNVIIVHLMCAVSLHLFLLSLDRFLKHRYNGQGMIATRLVVAIIMMYIISTITILVVLHLSSQFLLRIIAFNNTYIMRSALLSTLFLEIYGGRCKEHNQSGTSCSLNNSVQAVHNSSNNSTSNNVTSSYFA